MRNDPKPYEKYKHFKEKFYQIIAIAEDSETGEQQVVYQMLYSPFKIYVRSLDMFMSKVDRVKYPETIQTYRFEQMDDLENLIVEEVSSDKVKFKKSEIVSLEKLPSQEEYKLENRKKEDYNIADSDSDTEIEDYDADDVIEPLLLEFFEASTYEDKIEILRKLHPKITNDMINAMSITLDIEISDGELEQRFQETMNCLMTFNKFECSRL